MTSNRQVAGYRLPIDPDQKQGTVAQGFVTPKHDRNQQILSVPPKRVLPIIFIPGIMGSNLRMSTERQKRLKLKNNIAWRPDNLLSTLPQSDDSATERQLRFDPYNTELDTYNPEENPTGDPSENSDARNKEVQVDFIYSPITQLEGPLLQGDPPGTASPRTQDQKARERGWGEVYFGSYQKILATCEHRLNAAFSYGRIDLYLEKNIAGIPPSNWQATPNPALKELDEKMIRSTVKGCWFPVHAMGYNWLKGNSESGIVMAKRIRDLMKKYRDRGFQCEKVILVTHSMGGLVARAIIHPDMGNLNDQVLGIVHGVMPAMGAGTAYKRVRCGFEGDDTSAKILGHVGRHVTPVLANSQGGLELLPSGAYGNYWLQIKQNKKILKQLPEKGDPYEEIYKIRGKWFGLLREEWINPAQLPQRGFNVTCALLDQAKAFHAAIATTYHDQSYAHYGADKNRMAWHKVIWEISKDATVENIEKLEISSDDSKGNIKLRNTLSPAQPKDSKRDIAVSLLDAADPGDQTVPSHSADAQFHSGKFKGIFRQTGYERQSSYSNSAVLAATLYSLFQIASTMKWPEQ